jgi:2-hydroxychromene-2-carboxylate isomerase
MVTQEIDFLYDFGSPNAYLVHKVLPSLAVPANSAVVYVPILLGGVFKATSNRSPVQAFAEVKGKLEYQRLEMRRFVRRHNLVFRWNPHFPVNTITVMRGAIFAQGKVWERSYINTVFDAMWLYGKKMDDPGVIAEVLDAAGLPSEKILQATQTEDVKKGLMTTTSFAVERGVFGAPTMFVGDEMFFGKDSLPDLVWELDHPMLEDDEAVGY